MLDRLCLLLQCREMSRVKKRQLYDLALCKTRQSVCRKSWGKNTIRHTHYGRFFKRAIYAAFGLFLLLLIVEGENRWEFFVIYVTCKAQKISIMKLWKFNVHLWACFYRENKFYVGKRKTFKISLKKRYSWIIPERFILRKICCSFFQHVKF